METASCRDPHHFSVLLGFGATAIYPYLAYETLAKQVERRACSPCPCARPWSTTATASIKDSTR
ncbi:glutamate synthase central domain-containing protein [Escherichia coli]